MADSMGCLYVYRGVADSMACLYTGVWGVFSLRWLVEDQCSQDQVLRKSCCSNGRY